MELNDFDKPIYVRDPGLKYRKDRVSGAIKKYEVFTRLASEKMDRTVLKLEAAIDEVEKAKAEIERRHNECYTRAVEEIEKFLEEIPAAISRDERRLRAIENKQRREIASLQQQLAEKSLQPNLVKENPHDASKAKTLAIFDSILFAIESWSTDGQVASDCILCFQATLFPLVYMPIMRGNSDYYLEEVPASALEVVKRGREFVKHIRSIEAKSLMDPEVWDAVEPMLREWLINDGLPLIYGAKDEDWSEVPHFTQSMMLQWRDQPASRALDFPLIWDGMELVKAHSDAIRENSGLPEFNKQQITTRLEP